MSFFFMKMKKVKYFQFFCVKSSKDAYSVIFPNVSYKGKMFHYDDFPKIDYSQEL